jgi:2-isopropylmalate synthase
MAVMAGAERVEGTLFGHGERTGNVDLCTFALNLYSRGIDTGLDFSNMPSIVRVVEASTGIDVHERHPYAGQLAFTAFSGSHQDAIRKGMERKEQASELFHLGWKLPYLHIDPADLGRKYEKLIRINSQSGKGGVAYVLEHDYGIYPPKNMHPYIGLAVQKYADEKGDEIGPNELIEIFRNAFVDVKGPFELVKYQRGPHEDSDESKVNVKLSLRFDGKPVGVDGSGNGPISATVHAIRDAAKLYDFILEDFSEKTLGRNADAKAIAFVGVRRKADNMLFYGAGEHPNIDQAAVLALFSALNRSILDERARLRS